MSKVTLVLAAAAGYVLGARAGRERYEEIAGAAQRVWSDPRVQRRAGQAQDAAIRGGKEAGAKVGEKVSEVVHRSGTGAGAGGAASNGGPS